jgi:hypothetical protein
MPRWCSTLWPLGKTFTSKSPVPYTRARRRIDGVRDSKQIVQVGMQRRSYPLYLEAREICAAGTLGNVRLVPKRWINNSLTRRPAEKLTGPIGTVAGTGAAPPHGTRPISQLAQLQRLRRWHRGGPGSTHLRRHSSDSRRRLSNGRKRIIWKSSQHRGREPETVVVAPEYPEDFLGVFIITTPVCTIPPAWTNSTSSMATRRAWTSAGSSFRSTSLPSGKLQRSQKLAILRRPPIPTFKTFSNACGRASNRTRR